MFLPNIYIYIFTTDDSLKFNEKYDETSFQGKDLFKL